MAEATQRRIAIVTDSTSDLPRELADSLAIHIEPQTLIMGKNVWRDGVDIDPATFYRLLKSSSDFPSTSQASAASFAKVFARLAPDYDGIVAILISSAMSGTLNSAQVAAAEMPGVPIEIVDSRAASIQLGFIALAAARAAAGGADLQTVSAVARSMVDKVRIYFVVDTLEYLHRGGRIGAAARLFGSALNLKPVLEVRDGIVAPLAKIRTRHKALEKVWELVDEQIAAGDRVHMAVLHVDAPDDAARLAEEMVARYHPLEMITSDCGPVIGAHTGPGTVGVAFYKEE